jgi:L,D-peptidoglycan transpeptidase YkuD (ErfK/YbiS/YcfS/YnhG family)
MKYVGLFLLLSLVVGYCVWQQVYNVQETKEERKQRENTGIKWNDSLIKYLPKNIDTTVVVYDLNNTPLKFSQYIVPVFNHDAIIYQDRGAWRLHRLTERSQDSLFKDDFAVASKERRAAYLERDTIQSSKIKFDKITSVLARADYVVALKKSRKLYLFKNGKPIKILNMTMGWAPVGNKEFEGDGKTPEGIYHLDNKYYRNDEFYASINLSYPNFNDREIAKKRGLKAGYGVLIHGTKPNKINAKNWTAGCIALQNNDMDTLFKYVGEGTLIDVRK